MTDFPDLFEYICTPPPKITSENQYLPKEMTDEELFSVMDDIIEEKYPGDKTYDVSEDEMEPPPLKKQKACLEPENEEDESVTEIGEISKIDLEEQIRKKIECIFKRMQLQQSK